VRGIGEEGRRFVMNCPACSTANRPGATRCKKCGGDLPKTCAGCGDPVAENVDLCINCRTERVPAALGAELLDSELLEPDPDEAPPGFPISPRFVGHQPLIDRLVEIVSRAGKSRELQFVALTGPPGVGKTRLSEELLHILDEKQPDARVLRATCAGPGSPPFAAFHSLFNTRFGISDDDAPQLARGRISAAVAELLPASRATEVSHLLGHLLDYPFPDSAVVEPLAETPTQLEARTFIALRRFLAADAARTPLVLVLDEIERATPETVNLIHYLAAGLSSSPVVLLAIGRPALFEAHPSFGEGDVTLERVEMGPLSPDDSGELIRELVKPAGDPPLDLAKHAKERMGGVPRAVVELVRYLTELGAITQMGPKWKFDRLRLGKEPLPQDLEDIMTARLRVMEAGERDLLEKAAACGETFWVDAVVMLVRAAAAFDGTGRGDPDGPKLAEIAVAGDRTRAEVETALTTLARRGLLIVQSHSTIPGEKEYRFAYPPWWDVVYEAIDTDARRRYHRLIAQWLELRPEGRGEEAQEEIGRHLERAGDGDGAAVRYRRAADAARARYFNDKAVRLYSNALDCLGPGDLASRIHLWHDLGSVFQLKGENDSALAAFERMLRLSWVVASRTKAAVAFNKMGRIHRQKGDLPIALEYLERGHELFEQAGDERGVAGSLDDIGQVLWLLGRYDDALDRSAHALEQRRRLGDKRSIAASLVNVGNIERHRGLFDAAEACYREALDLRSALGDKAGLAQCKNGLGMIAFQRGEIETAKREWESALSGAESIGAIPLQAQLLLHLGEAALEIGSRGEARTRFEAAETLARDIDERRLLSESLRHLGLLDLTTGDSARARERCMKALEIAEAAGIRVDVGRALLSLGEVHAATLFGGESAHEAESWFEKGVQLFREIGNEAELAEGLERFGKYHVEHGDVEAGKVLLSEAESIFTRLGMRAGDDLRRMIHEL
jgi:tetratricopeptide (TPR) repeat protein